MLQNIIVVDIEILYHPGYNQVTSPGSSVKKKDEGVVIDQYVSSKIQCTTVLGWKSSRTYIIKRKKL